jgi:hypothetical protein
MDKDIVDGFEYHRIGFAHFRVFDLATGADLGVVYEDGPDWIADEPHGTFESRHAAAAFLLSEPQRTN